MSDRPSRENHPAVGAALGALALVVPLVAGAQTELEQALAECREISLERARLACFDAVLSGESGSPSPAPDPQPSASPQRPAAAGEPAPDVRRESVSERPEAEAGASESVTVRAEPPPSGGDGLGIVVTEIVTDRLGRRSFVTEDGRVFDQLSARKHTYPEEPFGATLEPASRNTFFLQAAGRRQSVRVTERN